MQSSKCALVGATSKYRVNEERKEKKEDGKGETRWCEPAPGRIAGWQVDNMGIWQDAMRTEQMGECGKCKSVNVEKSKSRKGKKMFPNRDSNPGLLGESQPS